MMKKLYIQKATYISYKSDLKQSLIGEKNWNGIWKQWTPIELKS